MSEIKPTCPYCGAKMDWLCCKSKRTWWYMCPNCEAESPVAYEEEDAIAAALHLVSHWHSVKDGLPDNDRDVLVACLSKSGVYNIDKGYCSGERMVHRGHAEVTHWMELPDPPKEDDHA